MKSEHFISIVIPLYKSENCLDDLINTLLSILKNYSFEIILIEDNSPDNTWRKVVDLKQNYPEIIRAIRLSRNYGQQKATFCGLSKAKGDIVITIDDDGVHPVEHLPVLIERFLSEKMDILYIIPEKYQYPLYRRMLSNFYKKISQVENPEAGKGSSFRLLSKNLVKSIVQHSSHLIVIDEIILWYTQNIHAMIIPFHSSKKKSSGYSFSKLFHLSKTTLMVSTTMPLIIVKTLGLTVAGISFLAGVYFLIKKFVFHHAEKGYTSIIVSILFGVGLILFSLGIIGEYIAYILMDIHKKPPYHIKEEL